MLTERVGHLEKVLLFGDGERLPLAEVVRNLTKTVDDYIKQKQSEEKKSAEQWDKWRWLIIGIVVPALFLFFGQAVIFFFKIWPILNELAETHP
jgi:hypothetical protein